MIKTRWSTLFAFLVILPPLVMAAQKKPATVSGTAVFISKDGKFAGVAPIVTIELMLDDLRSEFVTDQMGDFTMQVPSGTYTITGVVGCGGQKLMLYEKQHRTFGVFPNQFNRVDVMLKALEHSYTCTTQ